MKKKKDILPQAALKVAGQVVAPCTRSVIHLDVGGLYDYSRLKIPIEVIRGTKTGPPLFISAAIHGDEVNGVEIIKRLTRQVSPEKIRGTLFLIPVVNVFGFNNKSRYLPDRRDLNRSFPGNKNGSLASRLAHLFLKEVVSHCRYGIDLHTGALHRKNLPQIRACIDDLETKTLAETFGVPVVLNSKLRDGSLREAARKRGTTTLLYEGGEALRFDENVIRSGLRGCVSTMRSIGMLPALRKKPTTKNCFFAEGSFWVRSPHNGVFTTSKKLGDYVYPGDILAHVSDTLGKKEHEVICPEEGLVIGSSQIPLVNKGDAMFHIASFKNLARARKVFKYLDEI